MKILIEESVLRQALEAIGDALSDDKPYINKCRSAFAAVESALDGAEKVEPVAWVIRTDNTNLHELDPNRTCSWLDFDVEQFKHNAARSLKIVDAAPLYTHPAPAIPEGWQLVPKEPTGEMQVAGGELFGDAMRIPHPYSIYKAMLSAAGEPEQKP